MASVLRGNQAVRRVGIPAYQFAARQVRFLPPPPVFANSLPKAGTHLLTSLLNKLPKMMFSGVHHSLNEFRVDRSHHGDVERERLRARLRKVRNGQYLTGHFPAEPVVLDLLHEQSFRTLFITRDPRDIAVSQVFYICRLERHPMHDYFTTRLSSFDQRLDAAICGVGAGPGHPSHLAMRERLAGHEGWLHDSATYVVSFEDLVGPSGGGTSERQHAAIAAIAAHVNRDLDPERTSSLAKQVFSTGSATFRRGAIGDWRSHFTPDHIALFKREAGQELIDWGYEPDESWSA